MYFPVNNMIHNMNNSNLNATICVNNKHITRDNEIENYKIKWFAAFEK
jgi:hypothetical protein